MGTAWACVVLVPYDSPGVLDPQGHFHSFWTYYDGPGMAGQPRGPVAPFCVAAERRTCRLIANRPFTGGKESSTDETGPRGTFSRLTQEGRLRGCGRRAPPSGAWGSQGVRTPWGSFPRGSWKRGPRGVCGAAVLTCRRVTGGRKMLLLPRYRAAPPQPCEQVHAQGLQLAGVPEGWHPAMCRHQHGPLQGLPRAGPPQVPLQDSWGLL